MRSIVTVTAAATDFNLTTLDNLKLELGITDTDSDEQLTLWIAQASAVAARYCNRVLAVETVTETFRNAGSYPYEWFYRCGEGRSFDGITLTRYPIVSIASLSVDGTTLDTSEYEHDETEVYRLSTAGYPTRWWFGKSIVVSYVAGYTIPVTAAYADLERAVIAMIRDFRAVTLREDPNLKRRRTDGVSELEWWVPTASTRMLPIEISGMLDPFVRKWGWMS